MVDQYVIYVGIYLFSCVGAGANLFLLYLANGNLNFLRNDESKTKYIIGVIFIFLGGFIGFCSHLVTGLGLGEKQLLNIVLLGFGWQSVFSGGAVVLNNRKLRDEIVKLKAKSKTAKSL